MEIYNEGKGKRLGLRITQDEEGIVCHNKEKTEEKVTNYSKNHFGKAKESEVFKDKMCGNIIENNFRDNI